MDYLVVLPEEDGEIHNSSKIIYCKTYEVAVKLSAFTEGSVVYKKEDWVAKSSMHGLGSQWLQQITLILIRRKMPVEHPPRLENIRERADLSSIAHYPSRVKH